MALVIANEPAMTGVFWAAYNPIPFIIYANQPTSGDPSPVVYADVYFDDIYYGTISSTIYHSIVGPYGEYHFDIQDKCQEYLRSKFEVLYGAAFGNAKLVDHSTKCSVKFRETDINADGFTESVGSAPVQATYYTSAVSGDGLQCTEFYVLNCSLRHIDNIDLYSHWKKYTPGSYIGFDIGWNLSHRPNEVPAWGALIGSGKYWICYEDIDLMTFATDSDLSTVGGYLSVTITYLNNTTATAAIPFSSFPVPFPAADGSCITYYFNAGIPNLSYLLPSLTWTKIKKYTVYLYAPFADIATQTYYVNNSGLQSRRIRIYFVNLMGGYDAINFMLSEEISKAESSEYLKTKDYIFPDKKDRGLGRFQPKQADFIECWTEDYTEEDMPWIKELLGSAQAYIQVPMDLYQLEGSVLHPIVILPGEIVTKKNEDNFVYTVSIKFKHANETINLRS